MKKLFFVIALLVPMQCGSAEYSRSVLPEVVIENKGGAVTSRARTGLSLRIERFVRKNGVSDDLAPELAELLSICKYPRVLSSIPVREKTYFDPGAIGAVGEIGAFQIRPEFWGHPGHDIFSQTLKAQDVLEQLVKESNGSLSTAIRKYNGSGAQAEKYCRDVLRLARSI